MGWVVEGSEKKGNTFDSSASVHIDGRFSHFAKTTFSAETHSSAHSEANSLLLFTPRMLNAL